MITHLNGKLVEKTPTYCIIECNGVGYYVNISLNTFSKLKNQENCKLLTHFAVREDAQTLYGFADDEERFMFKSLISVSGVGASTARLVLSSLNPKELQQAIASNDVNLIKSVKGIGAKSAQRIIIDLKDKLAKTEFSSEIISNLGNTSRHEALSALSVLGFDKNKVEKIIDKILNAEPDMSVEELVKNALKTL